jgi:riboflavin transporter
VTGYVPEIPGVGGEWVQANANIYLYQMIKYLEIITGALILTNRFTLLGLILEMPASVNIFWLNTFIVATPRQLFTGPQELFLNGVLLLAYSGWMAAVLRPKLEPLWLWDGRAPIVRSSAAASPTNRNSVPLPSPRRCTDEQVQMDRRPRLRAADGRRLHRIDRPVLRRVPPDPQLRPGGLRDLVGRPDLDADP